jgi:hypothetical protein
MPSCSIARLTRAIVTKETTMRSCVLPLLLLLISSSAFGQSHDMKVHLKTGETIAIPSSEIRRIVFANLTAVIDTSNPGNSVRKIQFLRSYPNPFTPLTTIEYAISSQADVRVRIHDLRGAVVRELTNAAQAAGRHQVTWDGTDGAGAKVSGGLYFYRLECGTQTRSGRLVLVK